MAAHRAKKKTAWIASPKNELRGLDSIAGDPQNTNYFCVLSWYRRKSKPLTLA